MNYLEQYYSSFSEDARLLSRHGQVEYLTTMKYIHAYLDGEKASAEATDSCNGMDSGGIGAKRILEVGAGTGRYCLELAKEGYQVDAVELTDHNLEILQAKLRDLQNAVCPGSLKVLQGNALDLSVYEDNTFDLTLVLGPMYHLYTDEDKQQALKEAVRVTKPAGYIMVAYCMNESVIVQEFFMRGNVKKYLENNMVTEDFHCLSKPEDLFAMVRIEEIHRFTEALPVKRQKTVATDGASHYLKPLLAEMEDDIFACWLRYHFATCERPDLIGATNHSLDILQKLPE